MKFKDITFIIPVKNNQKTIQTLESIPKECKVIIRRDETRGEARNIGAMLAEREYIVFADSDIKFSREFLEYALSLVTDKNIVGLEAFYPSPLIISRLMILKKDTYKNIGDMLRVQHGEETEFCMRAIEKGYSLVRLPRTSVYHYPHKKSEYKNEVKNLFWLLKLHPMFPIRVLRSIMFKMKESSYDDISLPFK